jgi:hypothetical protein
MKGLLPSTIRVWSYYPKFNSVRSFIYHIRTIVSYSNSGETQGMSSKRLLRKKADLKAWLSHFVGLGDRGVTSSGRWS